MYIDDDRASGKNIWYLGCVAAHMSVKYILSVLFGLVLVSWFLYENA